METAANKQQAGSAPGAQMSDSLTSSLVNKLPLGRFSSTSNNAGGEPVVPGQRQKPPLPAPLLILPPSKPRERMGGGISPSTSPTALEASLRK